MLQRAAAGEISPYPQSINVLLHPFAGVVVTAVTHDLVSFKIIGEERIPNFFTIAELSTPNITGAPLRVLKVRAPGTEILSLSLTRSTDGHDLFVIVQTADHQHSNKEGDSSVNDIKTYLYKRIETPSSESSNVEVAYQRFPEPLALKECGSVPWTCSVSLNGWETISDSSSGNSNENSDQERDFLLNMAAASCSANSQSTALHFFSISRMKGKKMLTVNVEALSNFKVTKMFRFPGCESRVFCVCHNAVVEVDFNAVQALQTSTDGEVCRASTNAVVKRAWRTAPESPIISCGLKDRFLIAGTASGAVILWDLQDERVKAIAELPCTTAPVTGLYITDASTFYSCSLDGTLLCWRESLDCFGSELLSSNEERYQRFPYSASTVEMVEGDSNHFTRVSGEGWVDMGGDGNWMAVAGEFGTLELFLRV